MRWSNDAYLLLAARSSSCRRRLRQWYGRPPSLWRGTAARKLRSACNDAPIVLKQADRVVFLGRVAAEPGEDGEPHVEDMVAHLKRHGVASEVVRLKLGGDDRANSFSARPGSSRPTWW